MAEPPPPPPPQVLGAAASDEEAEVDSDGHNVLSNLLAKPPAEASAWVLDQVHALRGNGDVDVLGLPLCVLAHEWASTSAANRQTLVENVMLGLGELPPCRHVELVRFVLHAKEAVQRFETVGDLHGAPIDSAILVAEPNTKEDTEQHQTPLAKNLMHVLREAKLSEIAGQELNMLAEEAQRGAARLVSPGLMLDVAAELQPAERQFLAEQVASSDAVPEEMRGLISEAARPGSRTEQVMQIASLVALVHKRLWMLLCFAGAELLAAGFLSTQACGPPLAAWVRGDGMLLLSFVALFTCVGKTLGPAYEVLRKDTLGAFRRWGEAAARSEDYEERLAAAFPGAPTDAAAIAGFGVACGIALVIVSVVWWMLGLLEFMATATMGCSPAIEVTVGLLLGLRAAVAICLVASGAAWWRNSTLGNDC